MKKKREGLKRIENLDDVHLDLIKFILDNYRGSGLQKYKLEQWLVNMENPDKETKEMILEEVDEMFEGLEFIGGDEHLDYKSVLKDFIKGENEDGLDNPKIVKLLEKLATNVKKGMSKKEFINKLKKDKFLTPHYVVDYINDMVHDHKEMLKFKVKNHALHRKMNIRKENDWIENRKKMEIYDQFYDDKAAMEFTRLKKMKKRKKN